MQAVMDRANGRRPAECGWCRLPFTIARSRSTPASASMSASRFPASRDGPANGVFPDAWFDRHKLRIWKPAMHYPGGSMDSIEAPNWRKPSSRTLPRGGARGPHYRIRYALAFFGHATAETNRGYAIADRVGGIVRLVPEFSCRRGTALCCGGAWRMVCVSSSR